MIPTKGSTTNAPMTLKVAWNTANCSPAFPAVILARRAVPVVPIFAPIIPIMPASKGNPPPTIPTNTAVVILEDCHNKVPPIAIAKIK